MIIGPLEATSDVDDDTVSLLSQFKCVLILCQGVDHKVSSPSGILWGTLKRRVHSASRPFLNLIATSTAHVVREADLCFCGVSDRVSVLFRAPRSRITF